MGVVEDISSSIHKHEKKNLEASFISSNINTFTLLLQEYLKWPTAVNYNSLLRYHRKDEYETDVL